MKLYPEIILSAKKNNLAVNAFKVWFLAKDYCGARRGAIPERGFKEHLKALGVSRSAYCRWIKSACGLGLFRPVQSKCKMAKHYQLVSWQDGAFAAGCERLGSPANIDLAVFVGRSWISYVHSAFYSRFKDKPVSRETVTALTGVPRSTQKYREKRAKVKQVQNVAIHGKYDEIAKKAPDLVIALSEIPGLAFVNQAGDLCQQLPNSKELPGCIKTANKGRTDKVNKALKALFQRGAEAKKEPILRRYSDSPKQTKQIKRVIRKSGDRGDVIIYERFKRLSNQVQGWIVETVLDDPTPTKIRLQQRQAKCTI